MLSCPPVTTTLASPAADGLKPHGDRSQTRTANLVDSDRGPLDRNAGGDRGLARRILANPSGEHLPENNFIDFARLGLRAKQCFSNDDRTEVMGGNGAEGTVESPDRGPGGPGDNHVCH